MADVHEVWGMILPALMLAQAVASLEPSGPKAWNSLDNTFACTLHTLQGQVIRLDGSVTETVSEVDGRMKVDSSFLFRSPDAKWRFLSGKTGMSGNGLLASHSIHIDNIDDPAEAGFKPYTLQLAFANRVAGLTGPYGYAVLRDQSKDVERVKQGSDYPIVAVGACLMSPKAGAIR